MSIIAEPMAEPADRRPRIDPAPRRLLGYALAIGLVLEIGLRGGLANAAVALAVGLTARALWTDDRLERREARILTVLAIIPALFLAVRASPWLAWSNAIVSGALLVVAVLHARHGSILDSTPAKLLRRGMSGLERGVQRLTIVRIAAPQVSTDQRDRALRVIRGLLVVGPVLLVLVALLASADAVFASLLTPDLDLATALGHLLLTVLLASFVVALAGAASADDVEPRRRGRFGVVELTTILGLVGAVLALFVVSQLVALTDAGDRLIESAGLTPAEYARSGFFQLCWATGLLLAFLAVVRSLADPDALRSRVVVVFGAAVPALALGLVVVSLRRMALYDDAFGLTMLRLSVVGAALWMGAVLVMTAARNLGVGSGRDWLVAGAVVAGMALIVLANLANPEAFVARHNLDRAREGAELDVGYLATMSDDVVPVVAEAVEVEADPDQRDLLGRALRCDDDVGGVATLNVATRRAAELREDLCQ
jgi:two-component system, OmpR family, sensor histidine kinase BaeS